MGGLRAPHAPLFASARRFDPATTLIVFRHGIGLGPGRGGTPQMAVGQGGRGGVGMSTPLPCLDGEQLGSVAGLQVMQTPVKVAMSGYGLVKPSVRV